MDTKSSYYQVFKEMNEKYNVDIFNKNSPFFNDICFTFDNEGYDITLSKRKNMFYFSISCSEGCKYIGIDNDGYSICNCNNAGEGEVKSSLH